MKKILIASLGFFIFPISFASAAVIHLDPATAELKQDETFIAKIKLDNQGDCLNAIESGVDFSPSLKLVDFSAGNSIINLWIDKPGKDDIDRINLEKSFSFSGGIPGGFCGIISGDVGESNILAELAFLVVGKAGEEARISIKEDSQALLNDGKGTSAKVSVSNAKFSIAQAATSSINAWDDRLKEDDIDPEPFTIELWNDERMFNGKYFIIFTAQDKQTGIDHYEVMEYSSRESEESGNSALRRIFGQKKPTWKTASSPYLLEDQSLGSNIEVKAVDKAGNERTVKYFPEEGKKKKGFSVSQDTIFMVLLGLAALIIVSLTLYIMRLKNKTKK